MKKSFDEALSLLQDATEQTITAQILEVNRAIQNADEKEIIAIYHTVEATKTAVLGKEGISPAYSQLEHLSKSVIGRMAVIICNHVEMYGKSGANNVYKKFISSVIYDKQLDDALND